MKKAILFRIVFVFVAVIALSCLPQQVLAQRGGHGGGGGFHGGGGGAFRGGGGGGFHGGGGFYGGGRSAFAGGRSIGGYRGGGYYGGRGGYGWGGRGYGWGGGYWGRGYGWGWGFGFGFGWPYWGWGYPYGYGYSPWYYAPDPYYYSYPYYGPSGYPAGYQGPDNGNDDPRTADPNACPPANQNGPARSCRPPGPRGAANTNYANSNVATAGQRGPALPVDATNKLGANPNIVGQTSVTQSSYRTVRSIPERSTTGRATPRSDAPLRPEMQKALQRLREMPPFAREREIETGRYRQFSSEDKQILRNGK
jgi:hypothetical protein